MEGHVAVRERKLMQTFFFSTLPLPSPVILHYMASFTAFIAAVIIASQIIAICENFLEALKIGQGRSQKSTALRRARRCFGCRRGWGRGTWWRRFFPRTCFIATFTMEILSQILLGILCRHMVLILKSWNLLRIILLRAPSCHQLEPHHLDPGSQVQVILNGPCWLSAAMPPKHLAQGDSRSHAGQCPDHGSSEGSRCAPAIAWRSAASSIHTLQLFQMQCRYEAGVRLVQGQSLHLWHDLVVAAEQGGSWGHWQAGCEGSIDQQRRSKLCRWWAAISAGQCCGWILRHSSAGCFIVSVRNALNNLENFFEGFLAFLGNRYKR